MPKTRSDPVSADVRSVAVPRGTVFGTAAAPALT